MIYSYHCNFELIGHKGEFLVCIDEVFQTNTKILNSDDYILFKGIITKSLNKEVKNEVNTIHILSLNYLGNNKETL